MIKIAFVGNQMAGKTFAANYLLDHYKFKMRPLGTGVIKIYKTLFFRERYKQVPWERRIQIYDALYDIDPTVWVHYLSRRLETTTSNVTCHDPRYLSEVEALREMGFLIVRVTTPIPMLGRLRIGGQLGNATRGIRKGTVVLSEYYKPEDIKVDYSFVYESREALRRSLDVLMADLNLPHK